jgi:hypothetical protein
MNCSPHFIRILSVGLNLFSNSSQVSAPHLNFGAGMYAIALHGLERKHHGLIALNQPDL